MPFTSCSKSHAFVKENEKLPVAATWSGGETSTWSAISPTSGPMKRRSPGPAWSVVHWPSLTGVPDMAQIGVSASTLSFEDGTSSVLPQE